MTRFSRVLVILNPSSGQHDSAASRQLIEDTLSAHGITFQTCLTQAQNDALNWAKDAAAKGFEAVVAAGGDGTIVEALNGLLKAKSDLPLFVVPLGTANGLARTLKLPLEPDRAIEAALKGEVKSLDAAYVVNRDHYFLLFAGAGYDAQVIRQADREQKDKHGFMAYIYAALNSLKKQRNQYLTLVLDGQRVGVFAHSVIVFNAASFALAGVPLGPKVSATDGKLDIIVLRDPSAWGTLRDVWNVLAHRANPGAKRLWQASKLQIESSRPMPFQSDGDELGETPLEIEVKARAVNVVVPKAYLEA